ncbi:hypothetical protein C0991_008231 [Blastosporella zonata]|nr:hypothetical protein C0991_008231 [Blastosporella zonata]
MRGLAEEAPRSQLIPPGVVEDGRVPTPEVPLLPDKKSNQSAPPAPGALAVAWFTPVPEDEEPGLSVPRSRSAPASPLRSRSAGSVLESGLGFDDDGQSSPTRVEPLPPAEADEDRRRSWSAPPTVPSRNPKGSGPLASLLEELVLAPTLP